MDVGLAKSLLEHGLPLEWRTWNWNLKMMVECTTSLNCSFSKFIAYMHQIKFFLEPKTLVMLIEISSCTTYTLPMINLECFLSVFNYSLNHSFFIFSHFTSIIISTNIMLCEMVPSQPLIGYEYGFDLCNLMTVWC